MAATPPDVVTLVETAHALTSYAERWRFVEANIDAFEPMLRRWAARPPVSTNFRTIRPSWLVSHFDALNAATPFNLDVWWSIAVYLTRCANVVPVESDSFYRLFQDDWCRATSPRPWRRLLEKFLPRDTTHPWERNDDEIGARPPLVPPAVDLMIPPVPIGRVCSVVLLCYSDAKALTEESFVSYSGSSTMDGCHLFFKEMRDRNYLRTTLVRWQVQRNVHGVMEWGASVRVTPVPTASDVVHHVTNWHRLTDELQVVTELNKRWKTSVPNSQLRTDWSDALRSDNDSEDALERVPDWFFKHQRDSLRIMAHVRHHVDGTVQHRTSVPMPHHPQYRMTLVNGSAAWQRAGHHAKRAVVLANPTGSGKTAIVLQDIWRHRHLDRSRAAHWVVVPDRLLHVWKQQLPRIFPSAAATAASAAPPSNKRKRKRSVADDDDMEWDEKVPSEPVPRTAAAAAAAAAVERHVADDRLVWILERQADVPADLWTRRDWPVLVLCTHTAWQGITRRFYDSPGRLRMHTLAIEEADRWNGAAKMALAVKNKCNPGLTVIVTATPETAVVIQNLMSIHDLFASTFNQAIQRAILNCLTIRECPAEAIPYVLHYHCERVPAEAEHRALLLNVNRRLDALIRPDTRMYQGPIPPSNVHRILQLLERLGAGGCLDADATMALIQTWLTPPSRYGGYSSYNPASSSASSSSGPSLLSASPSQATVEALAASTDECAVCMGTFTEPLQLACRHVFCRECLTSMNRAGLRRCALCRGPWRTAAQRPLFLKSPAVSDAAVAAPVEPPVPVVPTPAEPPPPTPSAAVVPAAAVPTDPSVVMRGRTHTDAPYARVLDLSAKMARVRQCLRDHRARQGDAPLVWFVQEAVTAREAEQLLAEEGVPFLSAGPNVNKAGMLDAVARFQHNEASVLIMTYRYCEGFDWNHIYGVWLLNTCRAVSRMVQGCGRMTRLSQKYPEIELRAFVTQMGFDEFIWDAWRDAPGTKLRFDGSSKRVLAAYHVHAVMNAGADPALSDTRVGRLCTAIRHAIPDLAHLSMTATAFDKVSVKCTLTSGHTSRGYTVHLDSNRLRFRVEFDDGTNEVDRDVLVDWNHVTSPALYTIRES